MKNQFFLMIVVCLISNVAYSMNIDLDSASQAKLLEQAKKDNVSRGYWPISVRVSLERFYKVENTALSPSYCVRVVGHYQGFVDVELNSGITQRYPAMLGKATEGIYSKEELEVLGVQLPK